MSGTFVLSPTPVLQFFDNNGAPLVGGMLFIYELGTTTKQAAYTDSTGDTALPNPVILNSRGEVAPSSTGTSCGLWLDSTLGYKLVLSPAGDTDPPTNPIWTVDGIVSDLETFQNDLNNAIAALGMVPVGTQVPYGGSGTPTGWLLCDGAAVSRTTYAALFGVLGTTYGSGDGSTTFNLPDKRGRVSIGMDNLGGSAANRVTNAGSGVNATVQGAVGGSQFAQTDTLTATTDLTITVTDPGHFHYIALNTAGGGPAVGEVTSEAGATAPQGQTLSRTTGIQVNGSATTSVTSGNQGSSQNMPPVQVDSWIIYSGVTS